MKTHIMDEQFKNMLLMINSTVCTVWSKCSVVCSLVICISDLRCFFTVYLLSRLKFSIDKHLVQWCSSDSEMDCKQTQIPLTVRWGSHRPAADSLLVAMALERNGWYHKIMASNPDLELGSTLRT